MNAGFVGPPAECFTVPKAFRSRPAFKVGLFRTARNATVGGVIYNSLLRKFGRCVAIMSFDNERYFVHFVDDSRVFLFPVELDAIIDEYGRTNV